MNWTCEIFKPFKFDFKLKDAEINQSLDELAFACNSLMKQTIYNDRAIFISMVQLALGLT